MLSIGGDVGTHRNSRVIDMRNADFKKKKLSKRAASYRAERMLPRVGGAGLARPCAPKIRNEN